MNEEERREQRRIKQMELHEKIVAGQVDIGPQADHSSAHALEDRRDRRDPSAFGSMILDKHARLRLQSRGVQVADVADLLESSPCADYSHGESTVDITVREYKEKMQMASLQGSVFALRILLDKNWDVPEGVDQELLHRATLVGTVDTEVI